MLPENAPGWPATTVPIGDQPAIACVEKLGSIHQTLQDLATRYFVEVVQDHRELEPSEVV